MEKTIPPLCDAGKLNEYPADSLLLYLPLPLTYFSLPLYVSLCSFFKIASSLFSSCSYISALTLLNRSLPHSLPLVIYICSSPFSLPYTPLPLSHKPRVQFRIPGGLSLQYTRDAQQCDVQYDFLVSYCFLEAILSRKSRENFHSCAI